MVAKLHKQILLRNFFVAYCKDIILSNVIIDKTNCWFVSFRKYFD